MPNESVRGERTADLVARRISRAILSGELPPGAPLREESLASSYEVSRTPIREALIQLSAVGLVELTPNRGATVLDLTLEDVAEVYHLRAVLEAEAARLAARTISTGVVLLLEKSCERLGQLHDASPVEQLAADTDFHYRIAEASGSRRLEALIRQVSALPEAYRSTIAYTSKDMSEAERQHRAIAGELGRHRAAGAARLMGAHVRWAGELAAVRLEGRLRR
ncbi:MAG: GntR family transcriptional regulator [Acidimicrobiales bacterium]